MFMYLLFLEFINFKCYFEANNFQFILNIIERTLLLHK